MLQYDFGDIFCEHGIRPADFEALAGPGKAAVQALRELHEREVPSFLAMPEQDLGRVVEVADRVRAEADTCLVLGIGGSSLGAKAVYHALVRPHTNTRRDGSPVDGARLVFLENVDPVETDDVFEAYLPGRTVLNVISKSGGTVETMSSFFTARQRLLDRGGQDLYRSRVVATTDPEGGILRALADADGLTDLPVPPGVGGRFSVFTPVGLFPLAVAGIDIEAFLRGAARARDAALGTEPGQNPAVVFAGLQVALYEAGVHDVAFMPYVSGLKDVAAWFIQLWAESLGKFRGGEPVGPTPIPAVGATDQHSQLQLFMQGPPTKNVVFIETESDPVEVTVAEAPEACASLRHLSGKTLSEVRAAELAGVRAALAESGRPSSTFTLPGIDEESLGELMMTLSAATGLAGSLLGIDPYDQPGVELAKLFAHGILGRPAEAEYHERLDAMSRSDRHVSRTGG